MKKNVSITKAVQFVVNAKDERYTMLGIGPMSENFLRASLEIPPRGAITEPKSP